MTGDRFCVHRTEKAKNKTTKENVEFSFKSVFGLHERLFERLHQSVTALSFIHTNVLFRAELAPGTGTDAAASELSVTLELNAFL